MLRALRSWAPSSCSPAAAAARTAPARARPWNALTRIQADLGSIKQASALPVHDSLKGNPAINRATDRFLRDVALAPLDNLVRNRLIDHAAAFLLGSCEQCFQALEASRPIVVIEHAHTGVACHAKN